MGIKEKITSAEQETTGTEETADNYEVGYGKPPKSTQFKKGVSGNPRGRAKKLLDFNAALLREGRTFITVNKNGRRIRISKHDVVVNQVVLNAMKGTSSDRRLYRDAYREAFEKSSLLEAQRSKDLEKKIEDLSLEELMIIAAQGLPEPEEEK